MIKNAHCLFEQSGTFKNEFKKLGIKAYDYDILNDFGETDYQIDLFAEIEKAYEEKPSIFDNFLRDDIIFAFFPCTRFENQILLSFRGEQRQDKNLDEIFKLERCINLQKELTKLYILISKLAIIIYKRKLRIIIENPYSSQHYLVQRWCIKSSFIDHDRTRRGDFFVKPTQYWFINCEIKNKLCTQPLIYNPKKKLLSQNKVNRSIISKDYARRFIEEFIL